jgi:hypothetical protein
LECSLDAAELQKHTEKRHQSLTDDVKTSSFFSEAKGFWLSIHPEDYARLIKPTDHDRLGAPVTFHNLFDWHSGKYKGRLF